MRPLAIACGLLLAACSTVPVPPQPQARVPFTDLDLSRRDDQDILVQRVRQAAVDYCRTHAAIVTPHFRRAEPDYCPRVMRMQLMWAMEPPVRSAYDRGWARSDRRLR